MSGDKVVFFTPFISRGRSYIVRQKFDSMVEDCSDINTCMRLIVQYLETYELQFRQSGYHTMNLTRTRRLQITLGDVITDPDIAGRCGELIDCIIIDIPALNVQ